jgi:hypothetical protein
MNIELPPVVGIIPNFEYDHSHPTEMRYKAVIDIVGSYSEDYGGYNGKEMHTHERRLWESDQAYESQSDAVGRAVDKLADLLKGLL